MGPARFDAHRVFFVARDRRTMSKDMATQHHPDVVRQLAIVRSGEAMERELQFGAHPHDGAARLFPIVHEFKFHSAAPFTACCWRGSLRDCVWPAVTGRTYQGAWSRDLQARLGRARRGGVAADDRPVNVRAQFLDGHRARSFALDGNGQRLADTRLLTKGIQIQIVGRCAAASGELFPLVDGEGQPI